MRLVESVCASRLDYIMHNACTQVVCNLARLDTRPHASRRDMMMCVRSRRDTRRDHMCIHY